MPITVNGPAFKGHGPEGLIIGGCKIRVETPGKKIEIFLETRSFYIAKAVEITIY